MSGGAPFPAGVTVKVFHATGTNRYGDTTYAADPELVAGCGVGSPSGTRGYLGTRASAEFTDRRDTTVMGLTLYAPHGSPISATDQVELPDGSRWHVNGPPSDLVSPYSGWSPGMEVNLQEVRG